MTSALARPFLTYLHIQLDLDDLTVENAYFRSFDAIVRRQLDPMCNQLIFGYSFCLEQDHVVKQCCKLYATKGERTDTSPYSGHWGQGIEVRPSETYTVNFLFLIKDKYLLSNNEVSYSVVCQLSSHCTQFGSLTDPTCFTHAHQPLPTSA